jgi:hypothetical protein
MPDEREQKKPPSGGFVSSKSCAIIDDPDRGDDVLLCLVSKKGSLLPGVLVDHSDVAESDEDNGDGYQEDDEEKKIKVFCPGRLRGITSGTALYPVLHSMLYFLPGISFILRTTSRNANI